jgi:hypothetical protein
MTNSTKGKLNAEFKAKVIFEDLKVAHTIE